MSKTKRLLDVVDGLRSLADSLEQVADSIAGNTRTDQTGQGKHTEPPTPPIPPAPRPSIRYALCWQRRAARAKPQRSRRCSQSMTRASSPA